MPYMRNTHIYTIVKCDVFFLITERKIDPKYSFFFATLALFSDMMMHSLWNYTLDLFLDEFFLPFYDSYGKSIAIEERNISWKWEISSGRKGFYNRTKPRFPTRFESEANYFKCSFFKIPQKKKMCTAKGMFFISKEKLRRKKKYYTWFMIAMENQCKCIVSQVELFGKYVHFEYLHNFPLRSAFKVKRKW